MLPLMGGDSWSTGGRGRWDRPAGSIAMLLLGVVGGNMEFVTDALSLTVSSYSPHTLGK